jgi:serine/threonine-protein kinase
METNKRIGDYEILEELGRGGMGRVYKVRNVISDRVEAMKVLLPDLVGRQDLAARFVREIKVLAALHHPNIASLRTALTADNQLVMIMEFVDGESLANRLRRGPLDRHEALSYVGQALEALSYAHAQGVVHRDIKPANMMVTPQGVVKLTDFGIARARNDQTLTVAGTTTGSLSYMSPEQVNGEETDARSDLYSMGISLYELVTGERPFRAESDFALMVAHLKEAPRPPIELQPSLGPELNAIILKSIAKTPADRYQSAAEFRTALSGLQAAQPASAPAIVLGNAEPTIVLGANRQATPVPAASGNTATPLLPSVPAASPAVPPVPAMAAAPATKAVAAAAAAAQPPMPPPVARQGHPAVYVALGGALVLAVLIGAGLYIGRANAQPTKEATPPAASTPAAPAVSPSAPATTPATATTSPATPAPVESAASSAASAAAASSTAPATASSGSGATPSSAAPSLSAAPAGPTAPVAGTVAGAAAAARTAERIAAPKSASKPPAPPAAPSAPPVRESQATAATPLTPPQAAPAVDFDELETTLDQLTARAAAVDTSLTTMQREQARQGLSMRGDIVQQQVSMRTNLQQAEQAIAARNAARAKRALDQLEGNISALERFLGR